MRAEPSSGPRVTRVQVTTQRVYNLGNYKTLRYEVLADAEVPRDCLPSDVVDELTEFCDGKLAEYAAARDLDHLAPSNRAPSPFEEGEDDEDWDEDDLDDD